MFATHVFAGTCICTCPAFAAAAGRLLRDNNLGFLRREEPMEFGVTNSLPATHGVPARVHVFLIRGHFYPIPDHLQAIPDHLQPIGD